MQFRIHFRIALKAVLLSLAVVTIASGDGAAKDIVQTHQEIAVSATPFNGDDGFSEGRDRHSLDVWQAAAIAYNWVDISATGQTAEVSGNDSTSSPIPMGISFRWFGTTQTAVRISTNGFLTFTSTANTGNNTAIPNVAEPNGVFYVFWDDLTVDAVQGDSIKYLSDVANNRFIVSWRCRRLGGTVPLNFQAILNANGQVVYQYQTLDIRDSSTVGMENPDGTYGLQICYNGAGVMPAANSAYRVSEPAGMPNPVTNLAASTLGTNVLLTWTNPTTDVYGTLMAADSCDIYRNAIFVGRVGAGANSFSHANTLLGAVVYTVYAWNGVFPYPTNYQSLPTSVTVNVSAPVYNYQEDFELSDGSWAATPATGGWEWGIPTAVNGPSAHSGSKLWGTVLAGNYGNSACYQLDIAAGQPVAGTDAALAFWGWYKSEGGNTTTYDGCNLQISTNSGASWQILTPIIGLYDDTLMTANNTCIGSHRPTWNGSRTADSLVTGRWRYFLLPLSGYVGLTPSFRFTFGSDPAAANYPGFYLDDLSVWGLQTGGGGATVSGTITLDGGLGNVAQAVVRADGFGTLPASPNSLGAYTLQHVQLGQRVFTATLTDYQQAVLSSTVAGDLINANMTLRRQAPAAPTDLTSDLDGVSGAVTLDWTDSPDPTVDLYRVYRRRASDSSFTLSRVVYGRTLSTVVDTLGSVSTYYYVVTAVDTNVIAPAIESAYSSQVEVIFGALPPQSLHARADFDDHVRLTWVGPTDPPMVELSYDNGVHSPEVSGIGFSSQPLFGWIAARFQTTGAVTVHRIRIYFTEAALPGDAFQVGLFADNGAGRPTFTPLDIMDATIELPLNEFRDFYLAVPRTFTNGIFYVGARQLGDWPLGIGGDMQSPFVNNTFFFAADPWAWTNFEPEVLAIPMMRAIVQSTAAQGVEFSPSAWESPIATKETRLEFRNGPSAELTYLAGLSTLDIIQLTASRLSYATGPRAAYTEAVSSGGRGRSTLDEPDFYIVYRNGVDVARPTALLFDDYVNEGEVSTYWVTSHYAGGQESPPSDTVYAMPVMAPGVPTVIGLSMMLDSTMFINWSGPAQNADGTPCQDLDSSRVYRGNTLIGTVAASVDHFTDAPEYLNRLYTWSVRGVDEASNVGPAGVFSGSVLAPWENALFDWIDLSSTGTNAGVSGSDATSAAIPLGFAFPFYGRNYSQVRICTNGWLSFLNTSSVVAANVSLPTPADPNAAVYAFWDDLNVVAASGQWIKYRAEPDWFVVSWRCQQGTNTTIFEFQVILEANGTITLQYMSLPPTMNSYTMGVEDASGTRALMLLYNGTGDWFPMMGSGVQIFAPPPVFAPASGNVVFDGGNGTMTSVTVSASGVNQPSTHPLIDGTWAMDSVAAGYRRFEARLTGFVPDTVYALVPDSGVTNLSFSLRRNNPPAPTGFSTTINTATQIVTLNWTDSPDLLVDAYRVYRKPVSSSTWTLLKTVEGRTNSAAGDTLVGLVGGYNYAVTAIDTNVSGSPVESAYSALGLVIAGHPAPRQLAANGNFDDRIRLTWAVPGLTAFNAHGGGDTELTDLSETMQAPQAVPLTKGGSGGKAVVAEPRGREQTLDEVTTYRIFRDGSFLTTVAGNLLLFDDTSMPENQTHSYYVTAFYDDNQESGPSNVVNNARCNLAPSAPTNFTLTPWGVTMRLDWEDPTVNAQNGDGINTPCTDLTKIYIYRDNALLDSVVPGVLHYTDTPPSETEPYTWALRALDEIPNLSAAVSRLGIVESPWQPREYDWVDISATGTTVPFTSGGDANYGPISLGFDFPYYGINYNSIRVCTNGWLTFSTSTSTSYTNALIPNTSVPNAALYLFWDDLVVTAGWVKYLSEPGTGRFIITWNAQRTSTDPYAQMQIILSSNGAVKYQYQSLPGITSSCTVGLENAAGTEGIQLLATGGEVLWTPAAESAVEFWGGPSGSVEGVVATFTTGTPVADCFVWATSTDVNTDTMLTDATGHYLLRLEPGTYTLHFEHPNFCPTTEVVVIEENVPLTQNVQLRSSVAQFSVTSVTIVTPQGRDDSSMTFTIRNLPSGLCALDYVISDTSAWLRVAPASGILNPNQTATIRVYADVHGYPANTDLNSTLTITYHGTGSPYRIRVDVTVVPNESTDNPATLLPEVFALRQSYPNPFNPSTQLRFDVPKESLVDLMIYNVMGQEVAHPVSSVYQPGRYGVVFNASGLPSGMYLVRMQSGGFSAVNKMMLLR